MNKNHIDEWTEINKFVQKLSDEGRQKLFEELKHSGSVEIQNKYTETHLKGGEADEDKVSIFEKNMNGRWN
ncbi:hypothetical protein [Pelosinus baikalensis]|uniref:General stress protein CsbD n=1 Tax=Pelosinus baikalensis TaxID=2892015 RepID=A0ABS8HUU6_9FIRM|nr:hypothetical protein [Pelosinus baikalensis]MCC5466938.1 hypothetical protein [Pelosinus baikalensis]